MVGTESNPELLTPDEAAAYLRLDRETVYRYIRSGKLVASKLGRHYRIPRRSVEQLLMNTRVYPGREWTWEQIEAFVEADTLNENARKVVEHFSKVMEQDGHTPVKLAQKP